MRKYFFQISRHDLYGAFIVKNVILEKTKKLKRFLDRTPVVRPGLIKLIYKGRYKSKKSKFHNFVVKDVLTAVGLIYVRGGLKCL